MVVLFDYFSEISFFPNNKTQILLFSSQFLSIHNLAILRFRCIASDANLRFTCAYINGLSSVGVENLVSCLICSRNLYSKVKLQFIKLV